MILSPERGNIKLNSIPDDLIAKIAETNGEALPEKTNNNTNLGKLF